MSCGVSRRDGSDLALLWLWRRPVAIAPIQPLVWDVGQRWSCREGSRNRTWHIFDTYLTLIKAFGAPVVAQWLRNPTRNHEVAGSVPALAQWVKDPALP